MNNNCCLLLLGKYYLVHKSRYFTVPFVDVFEQKMTCQKLEEVGFKIKWYTDLIFSGHKFLLIFVTEIMIKKFFKNNFLNHIEVLIIKSIPPFRFIEQELYKYYVLSNCSTVLSSRLDYLINSGNCVITYFLSDVTLKLYVIFATFK